MNISNYKYFKEIVERKSISKVAKSNHISQSALSQIIQKLEVELGYQLLNRSNKGVYPTDMGQTVYNYAVTLIAIHEKMINELTSKQDAFESIHINGTPAFNNYSLPCLLYQAKKRYPNFKFDLHSRSSEASYKDLLDEVTDIAFVNVVIEDDRYQTNYIGTEKIVLAGNYHMNIPESIGIEDLYLYELILLENSFPYKNYLKTRLEKESLIHKNLRIPFEVDSIGAAKSSIQNGLGLSFLPYRSIKKELADNSIKIIEVENLELSYDIYLVSKKDAIRRQSLLPIIEYFVNSGSSEFC